MSRPCGRVGGPYFARAITPEWLAKYGERFRSHVITSDGCWLWDGAHQGGYAIFSTRSDGTRKAHRVAYALAHGGLAEGLPISHLCHNRGCVNPAHLVAESMWENTQRSPHILTVVNAQRRFCVNGHPLEDAYIRVRNTTRRLRRVCAECARIYRRAHREDNRAAVRRYRQRRKGVA